MLSNAELTGSIVRRSSKELRSVELGLGSLLEARQWKVGEKFLSAVGKRAAIYHRGWREITGTAPIYQRRDFFQRIHGRASSSDGVAEECCQASDRYIRSHGLSCRRVPPPAFCALRGRYTEPLACCFCHGERSISFSRAPCQPDTFRPPDTNAMILAAGRPRSRAA